ASARLHRVAATVAIPNVTYYPKLKSIFSLFLILMSRNYKFHNSEGLYFVSFAVVEWLDVFTRNGYKDILLDSLSFCQKEKGMEIISWCIMTNHVHLIFRSIKGQNPEGI